MVRLYPGEPGGYRILGDVLAGRGDLLHAEAQLKKTLAINASQKEPWIRLGRIYSAYGLYGASSISFGNALALDPADREALTGASMIHIGEGRYPEAERLLRGGLARIPGDPLLSTLLGLSLYYQKRYGDAGDFLTAGFDGPDTAPLAHAVRGMIWAREGKLDEALGEVELEVKPHIGNSGSLATAAAAVYSLLGRKGLAMEWLEKAFGWDYREYPWMDRDPNFDALRDDKRFILLMEKMKAADRTQAPASAAHSRLTTKNLDAFFMDSPGKDFGACTSCTGVT